MTEPEAGKPDGDGPRKPTDYEREIEMDVDAILDSLNELLAATGINDIDPLPEEDEPEVVGATDETALREQRRFAQVTRNEAEFFEREGEEAKREDKKTKTLLDEQARRLAAKNDDKEMTTRLRGKYAGKAYDLALGSICFWGGMMFFQAVCFLATGRAPLSDAVLIAITTGSTVNVLAAFLGVIRGLFPTKGAEKARGKTKKPKNK